MTTPRNGIDWGWVSRELGALEPGYKVNEVVTGTLAKLAEEKTRLGLTDDELRNCLDIIHKLALGHSIAPTKKEERWGPVIPGEYRIGDTVRVKPKAYDAERGVLHNNRRGRVVAARDGKVLVVYDDALSADIQYRHDPQKLQRLLS